MEEAGSSLGRSRRYLVVRAGGMRFGLPADSVRRVIRAPDLWPVPGAEPRLLGLIQYGGEPLAVLDLATLQDVESARPTAREVVVVMSLANDLALGVAVEDAEQVLALTGAPGEDGPADLRLLETQWLLGVGGRDGE